MSEPLQRAEIARHVRQHLDSLRTAGVEWLPLAALAAAPAACESATPAPATQSSPPGGLFAFQEEKPVLAREERRRALQVLTEEVGRCTRCSELASTRTQTVFGVGPMDAEICFVGEAPGADEDAQGEPFVGAAGQLLNRIITACGMKREEVYICNILRCRPPGNRLPLPNEAANCREYLDRTLELIQPRFICCLRACAAQNLLATTLSAGRLR